MPRATSSFMIALALLLAFAPGRDASAQNRTEVVRWVGNDVGDTDGYQVHYGTASRDYSDSIDVGIPAVVNNAYQTSISVPADAEIYIAVTAYNSNAASFFSNENCKGPNGACESVEEPPEPPEPPPTGVQSQITGFALWDATSDSVVDSNFTSGEQISVQALPCAAIEIKGNQYLDATGPGSIRKSLDGQTTGSCATPGVTHENSSPFAWETDTGPGKFECAPSLTVAGTHTLTVTPFDGDDCTGAEGTTVVLDFEVVDDTVPPPPPEEDPTPGQPGQPFLVFP